MKFRISLNGHWTLRYGKQPGPVAPTLEQARSLPTSLLEARVPGNVELDLQQAGVVPPLERENHVFQMQDFEDCFWWFERPLTVPRFSEDETVELVLDGVDCLATIYVDDQEVARLDNMLIPWRIPIGPYLRPGQAHRLTILVGSAVLAARNRIPAPGERALPGKWESLAIRKAPHMYGWDILPRLVGAGIWRDAAIEVHGPTRWRSVYIATPSVDPATGQSTLWIDWDLQSELHDLDELRIRVVLQRLGHVWFDRTYPVYETHGRITESLEQVKLWWPRGYGEPALHDLRCTILNQRGRPIDSFAARIGFRTVALERSNGAFTMMVNHQPIFCRGPVWTVLDALHSRDPQHARATLDLLRELNCTMVRCWGGGVYPDEQFFDFCDEHGVLVWQDFAFADAAYPQDASFLEAVREEASTIARRLRNHPSLALWYAGNANDPSAPRPGEQGGRVADSTWRSVLQETICHLDLYRPYLADAPPAPPSGSELRRVGSPSGDFRACFPPGNERPFVHEIGAHGCPARETLEAMFAEAHLWPWQDNEQWYARAVRSRPDDSAPDYRIHDMSRQIEFLFGRVPDSLDDFILASQIAQAEALKFFMEWARQRKPAISGLLWWHLRDGWPVLSEAVVDYYHRRKLAWAFLQRSQADLCVVIGHRRDDGGHPVVVINDSLRDRRGHVRVLAANGPEPVFEADFQVEANRLATLGAIQDAGQWQIDWTADEATTGANHACGIPPPFDLRGYADWLRRIGYPVPAPTPAPVR